MEQTQYDLQKARRRFSLIGFAYTGLVVSALLAQLLLVLAGRWIWGKNTPEGSWWMWLQASAPMYFIAFPITVLTMHLGIPSVSRPRKSLTKRQFLSLLPISFCIMYAGNIVGTMLSLLLSGGQAVNEVQNFALDQSPLKILVMVIMAPLLEELICRKLLIDRIGRYGEKLAVLVSGLTFGLLHQNFFQFFYAFGLGCVFAYVYVRTGKLRYTVILHAIINFLGAVVAPWILQLAQVLDGMDATQLQMQDLLTVAGCALVMLTYMSALMGLSVFGLVLLIIKLRRLSWNRAEEQLPKKEALKAAFLNAGMILFFLVSTCMIVWALF